MVGGSFGFQEAIKKIGVERRLYTAGSHKAMLDPFLPENPDDVAKLKTLQREIHQIFIALVKESRGARLKGADCLALGLATHFVEAAKVEALKAAILADPTLNGFPATADGASAIAALLNAPAVPACGFRNSTLRGSRPT